MGKEEVGCEGGREERSDVCRWEDGSEGWVSRVSVAFISVERVEVVVVVVVVVLLELFVFEILLVNLEVLFAF